MTAAAAHPQQFVALNALRGVAALVVVQRHGHEFLGLGALPCSYLAVDFFFLLSGWVLAHAYDRRLDAGMSAIEFMRARLLRLYPVYALGLLLALAAGLLGGESPLAWFAVSLLFLPDFWVRNFLWFIPATWTLGAELAINLPFGALHRRLATPVLLGAVVLGAGALGLIALAFGTLDAGYCGANWLGGPARVLFDFPLGILLYRHRGRLARWAPTWATWPSIALLVACMSVPAWGMARPLADLGLVGIALPLLLLFASNAAPGPHPAGLATALGDLSYPIYILHAPLLTLAGLAFGRALGLPLSAASPAAITALLFGLVMISLLVDRWFDKPIRRLFLRPPTSPLASPAAS